MAPPPGSQPAPADPSPPARPRRTGLIVGVACLFVGLALVAGSLVARDDDPAPAASSATSPALAGTTAVATTAPVGSSGIGEGVAPARGGRRPLRGFGEVAVTVTSGSGKLCQLCLLAATTPAQRQRGLMEVTDPELGGYDGMLFEFSEEVDGAFWMRNTPMPLAIAYFDGEGALVSATSMEPCADLPGCRTYPPDGPFQYALEVPDGRLAASGVEGDARLWISSEPCPLATQGG